MGLRIERELAEAGADVGRLYADLLAFWSAGLLPHFRVEGECLLARLIRHVPESDDAVLRLQRDHLGMAALVARMRDSADDAGRRQALEAFGEQLRTHIRWEEQVLFERVQEHLSGPELDALGAEIAEALPQVVPAPPS